jgi:hypothetical protein
MVNAAIGGRELLLAGRLEAVVNLGALVLASRLLRDLLILSSPQVGQWTITSGQRIFSRKTKHCSSVASSRDTSIRFIAAI